MPSTILSHLLFTLLKTTPLLLTNITLPATIISPNYFTLHYTINFTLYYTFTRLLTFTLNYTYIYTITLNRNYFYLLQLHYTITHTIYIYCYPLTSTALSHLLKTLLYYTITLTLLTTIILYNYPIQPTFTFYPLPSTILSHLLFTLLKTTPLLLTNITLPATIILPNYFTLHYTINFTLYYTVTFSLYYNYFYLLPINS